MGMTVSLYSAATIRISSTFCGLFAGKIQNTRRAFIRERSRIISLNVFSVLRSFDPKLMITVSDFN
jgi:hypothetical protein